MNKNIDTIIDFALAKDKANLPVQPNGPEASLLSKLGSTASATQSSTETASTNALIGIGTSKFLLLITGFAAIGMLSYVLSSSPVGTTGSSNPMIFVGQDSVKPKKPADSIHLKESAIKEKMKQGNALRIENPSDTSLIYPQGQAKKFQSDSIGLPIRK